jgi:hypothetical protein
MPSENNVIVQTIGRIMIVLAVTLATGYLFFRGSIFVVTRPPSEFLTTAIAATLFYAFAKSSSMRNGFAAVLVWYVASSLFDVRNSWLCILFFVYFAGMAAVIYFYFHVSRKTLLNGIAQGIATISILTGIMNALAIFVLASFSALFRQVQLQHVLKAALDNFQLGTLIGLAIGTGIEIAEYLLALKSFREFIEGENAS